MKFPRATRLMFQLSKREMVELVAVCDRFGSLKHSTSLPYAFTEQGVAMLSGVLKSRRAIEVNIRIMRAFVRFKEFLLAHKELAQKIDKIAAKTEKHDEEIDAIFDAIRQLMQVPEKPRQLIGFHP